RHRRRTGSASAVTDPRRAPRAVGGAPDLRRTTHAPAWWHNPPVLAPYRKVLPAPGALAFSPAGALARPPPSMGTLSVVLLVGAVYGSSALAGQVAAVYAVARAVCAPQLAKLVDRYGQARVMRPWLVVAMAGLTGVAVAAMLHGPSWLLYPAAAIAGGTVGSMGALVRSRWNTVVEGPSQLHTAYSLES